MSLATWYERHRALVRLDPAQKRAAQLVFMGDSIVEGFDDQVFREFYAARSAVRLGLGGDKTENVLWRIEHGELDGLSPRVLVLLIGTNNLADEATTPIMTARGIAKILAAIRQRLPSTRVLLLGVLPREPEPADPLRSKVRTTNQLIARFADGARVRYLDVGARLIGPDGRISPAVMQDFLHPTAEGYRLVAEALEPELGKMLAESR